MFKHAILLVAVLFSFSANATLVQLQFSGNLSQTTDSLPDIWGLNGASYVATFIIDDADYLISTAAIQKTTHFELKKATLRITGSSFDGLYHGTGSSSCCGGTLTSLTWDNNVVPWGDEVSAYRSSIIGGSSFDWGGDILFHPGLFTFGETNSPLLAINETPINSFFKMDTDNGESYWLCDESGCYRNPEYLEAEFRDYSTVYSITTVTTVPIPATIWLLGSALIGLLGFSRKKFFHISYR